ncbi:hypothetical protein C0Q70_16139 [Pomacea canaliculata]|uniref:Uncharacterized protein n=1 Tax=Pomacea canaliculata TaxID=400727 RepID=A0A2T7NNX6_POMCA|nr:hypothetical protein C0Q70_16139 [Pomacea canaliculata]
MFIRKVHTLRRTHPRDVALASAGYSTRGRDPCLTRVEVKVDTSFRESMKQTDGRASCEQLLRPYAPRGPKKQPVKSARPCHTDSPALANPCQTLPDLARPCQTLPRLARPLGSRFEHEPMRAVSFEDGASDTIQSFHQPPESRICVSNKE